jgi:transcription elongation factor GreB
VSKAFTKEDGQDEPLLVPSRAPLPPGATNYVTPRGLASLRAELHRLNDDRRERSGRGEPSADGALHLAALEVRIHDLEARIASAVLVDSAAHSRDEVRFGARVIVRGEDGRERRYEIVGVDEADAKGGRVAFLAPLARALLGKRVGDVVTLQVPGARGRRDREGGEGGQEEELEVVAIE